MGIVFALFAAVGVSTIGDLRGHDLSSVFGLVFFLFQGFWALGWSVGVVILFALTILLAFGKESAWLTRDRLVQVPQIGPLKILLEYDLAKIRNVRVAGVTGRPGFARIRFDYGTGAASVGSDAPREIAERVVRTIQTAVAAVGGVAVVAKESPSSEVRKTAPPPMAPAPVESPGLSASGSALLVANLVPLAGVLVFGWDLGEVMILFWAENVVIGFYALLKLVVVAKWAALLVGPFFIGHYGGFQVIHFLFVYFLFVRGLEGVSTTEPAAIPALLQLVLPLWPALATLFLSHGVSFATNFLGRREYLGRTVKAQMTEPYKRIIALHLTIIFGGWAIMLLGQPLAALLILIALKTAMDLRAHRREHRGS